MDPVRAAALILILALSGCGLDETTLDSPPLPGFTASSHQQNELTQAEANRTPEQTLEQYFQALNAGDMAKCSHLLSDSRRLNMPDFSDVRSARLIRIHPTRAAAREAAYKRNHDGVYDVRILWVEFEITFYRDRSMSSGRHVWNYILVRETETSPWVIADWGY